MKASKLQDESQYTATKNRLNTLENMSTTRKQQKTPFQYKSTEDNDSDTYRSEQAFRKLKNLEFQNDMYMMEMQHASRRKEAEDNRLKLQLSSIKSDIDFMKSQIQSPVIKQNSCRKLSDSERSSDFSSSSSNESSFIQIKCPIKFKHESKDSRYQNHEQIESRFKKLFQISDINDKFNVMVKQYFNSLHAVQIDLQNNLIPQLLESALQLLIDLIEKLNSIKLDSLQYKAYDPLPERNIKRFSSDFEIDASSPEFQLPGASIMDYCQKLVDQPRQFQSNIKSQTLPTEQQSARQLQSMMKQSKPESSCQTSNNQTLDKKVSISERSQKKTTQKCQLMPSLKNRQK